MLVIYVSIKLFKVNHSKILGKTTLVNLLLKDHFFCLEAKSSSTFALTPKLCEFTFETNTGILHCAPLREARDRKCSEKYSDVIWTTNIL